MGMARHSTAREVERIHHADWPAQQLITQVKAAAPGTTDEQLMYIFLVGSVRALSANADTGETEGEKATRLFHLLMLAYTEVR